MIARLAVALMACGLPADDAPLDLADLSAYREALTSRADPAPSVTFRQLWDHPETYRGKAVRVSGTVVRRFGQEAVGDFPALLEVWIVSPEGDPTCLVAPRGRGRPLPEVGEAVGFTGVFLKRLQYRGADTPRLAPLIVGPRPPASLSNGGESPGLGGLPWGLAVVVGGIALVIVVSRHLDRPIRRQPDRSPEPTWIEPEGADVEEAPDDDEP